MSPVGYITTQQAAEILGVSERTIQRYAEQGVLRAERIGLRTWLVREADLRRLKRPKVGRPKKPKP
jgi:excisionase family DNA binding protein